jgi:succinate-semialdehyde dehydrogenase/glutarate-semialdehyde dehydrogenase
MARADLRDELHRCRPASPRARAFWSGEPIAGTHAGYPATVLDQVGPGMPAYDEELFGPVAAVIGLAMRPRRCAWPTTPASAWAAACGRATGARRAFAQRMECGAAFVNAIVKSDARLPFGGSKQSGFGRELADHGIHEFMNIKTVYVA